MKSVRRLIIEKIVEAFENVQLQEPDPDTPLDPTAWPLTFGKADLGPLKLEDLRRRFSLGIVAGRETERATFPYWECTWQVALEFRITINKGEDPALMAEDVLTVVKRVIDQNRSWGGIAVDTKRTSNELDLSSSEKAVFGVQFIEIMYRTSHLDPRDPNPDP